MKVGYKLIISSAFLLALLACALIFSSCSSTVVDENRIVGIEISNEKGDVKVEAALTETYVDSTTEDKIYLLAFHSGYTGRVADFTVVGESKVKKNMSFKFNINDEGYSALISAPFILAERVSGEGDSGSYKAITDPAYVSNPDKIAKSSSGTNGGGFKGLQTSDINDANYLGAGSVLFEVDMGEIMLPEYTEDAINFYFEGNSYYFDKTLSEGLDKLTSDADRLGMRIYLRTVLKYPEKDSDGIYLRDPLEAIYTDCSARNKSGYLPALDSEGLGYVKAFYAFLSSRYGKNGALDYIIGNGVNNYSTNCYAGEIEADALVACYYAWARCANNVLKTYEENARVYISVDNALRNDGGGGALGTKLFLNSFAAYSRDCADWDYGVSLDLGNGSDISDVLSGRVDQYSYIGVNNLADLAELLDKPEHQYAAERRPIIIDSLSLPGSISEKNRAAYYSYAYYKAKEAGYSCFIYSSEADSTLYTSDGSRSDLYYSFLMCGSNYTSQLKDYTSKITGGSAIDFSSHVSRKLTYEQNVATSLNESVKKKNSSFPVSFGDFAPAGSCINLDVATVKGKDGVKTEKMLLSGGVTDMYAAMTAEVPAAKLIESGYVGITLSSPEKPAVALIIHDSNTGASYVGEAQISDSAATYYFNISSFTENIDASDNLQVSLCILKGNAENVSMTVENMRLYGSSGNGADTVVIIVIVAVVILALCGLIVLLAVTRKKKTRHED